MKQHLRLSILTAVLWLGAVGGVGVWAETVQDVGETETAAATSELNRRFLDPDLDVGVPCHGRGSPASGHRSRAKS